MPWLKLTSVQRAGAIGLLLLIIVSFVSAGQIDISRAQDTSELVGDFAVTIPDDFVPQDVADGPTMIGRWRLSFYEDGTYDAARLDVGVLFEGSYEVEGDQLTVTDEGGALSCASDAFTGFDDDPATATYSYDLRSSGLSFTVVEEGCPLRRVLFTASDFSRFVACLTGLDSATPVAAVEPQATPVEETESDEEDRGGASPLDILDDTTPEPNAQAGEQEDVPAEVEQSIDDLLGQMTACWSSGDPDRFLPLLSQEFQEAFLSGTDEEREIAADQLRAAMQVPLTWERAGEVTMESDTEASAVVRTTALDEEEFVRYLFVFENGAWRWDGAEV